jgi:flagellar basal-body rod protein FlgB
VVNGLGDVTMNAVEYALRGVAARADVRADNLANVNTPGYQAKTVSFESVLAQALQTGDTANLAAPQPVAEPGTPDANGNDVSMSTELIGGVKDNLSFETLVNAYNFKIDAMRIAIGRKS